MFEFDEQVVDVSRHTDVTSASCVVPFDVNTHKFVANHVGLDLVELLKNIAEMIEVFKPSYSTPKSSTMGQNWMGRHL